MLNRLNIKKKLFVLLAAPMIGLAVFVFFELSRTTRDLEFVTQVADEIALQAIATDMFVEVQRERGLTIANLSGSSSQVQQALAKQREAVDRTHSLWKEWLNVHQADLRAELRPSVDKLNSKLSGLADVRSRVDRREITPPESIVIFTAMANDGRVLISQCGELTPDPEQYSLRTGYSLVVQAAEGEGFLRAFGGAVLAAGEVSPEHRVELLGRRSQVRDDLSLFDQYVAGELGEKWRQLQQAAIFKTTASHLQTMVDWQPGGSFGSLDTNTWIEAQTEKINLYVAFLKVLHARIDSLAQRQIASSRTGLWLSISISLLVILASIFPALAVSRRIVNPLSDAVASLAAVAKGDFTQRVEVTSQDEIGKLGQSINDTASQLAESLVSMARSQNLVENAPINIMMADRDLKLIYINPASLKTFKNLEHLLPCKASEMLGGSIDIFHKDPAHQRKLLSDPKNLPYHAQIQLGPEWLDLDAAAILDKEGNYLGPMVSWTVVTDQKKAKDRDLQVQAQVTGVASELNQNSTDLVTMSNTMAANAEENSSQATNVSAAAEQVSANVSSVAAAVEEMTATIQEVSKTVVKSSEVTRQAVQMSKKATGLVTQLGESSNEISQVTKVIASIAQQTNILALNATIEAARAGEAGKGFAVVANEVKELAKSTSKMTEDISTRIAGIQQSTSEAVLSIEEINRIMTEVDSLSSTVASAVEEQSATTNEISRSMSEASAGVNEIVKNITGMAEAAKDTSKQALSSKEGAEGLGQLAGRLQEIIELFAKASAGGTGSNGFADVAGPASMRCAAASAVPARLS